MASKKTKVIVQTPITSIEEWEEELEYSGCLGELILSKELLLKLRRLIKDQM